MNSEHKGLPVAGYRPQSESNVIKVNEHKEVEERLLRRMDQMRVNPDLYDQRWLALARTNIEIGFMALNRAVFQPGRINLPEDQP